jgi:hypothetical protein
MFDKEHTTFAVDLDKPSGRGYAVSDRVQGAVHGRSAGRQHPGTMFPTLLCLTYDCYDKTVAGIALKCAGAPEASVDHEVTLTFLEGSCGCDCLRRLLRDLDDRQHDTNTTIERTMPLPLALHLLRIRLGSLRVRR